MVRLSTHEGDPRLPFANDVLTFCEILQSLDSASCGWMVHPRSTTRCDCLVEHFDEHVITISKYATAEKMSRVLEAASPDFPADYLKEICKSTADHNWIIWANDDVIDVMERWPNTHSMARRFPLAISFDPEFMHPYAATVARAIGAYIGFAQSSYVNYRTATSKFATAMDKLGLNGPSREELYPPSQPGVTWWIDEIAAMSARWICSGDKDDLHRIRYSLEFIGEEWIDQIDVLRGGI